jgi:hypothetical protein
VIHGDLPDAGADDRIGGRALGFPAHRWPYDTAGMPMSPLLRMHHHSSRLDLGADGRVLFAFLSQQWWEAQWSESGPGAVLILEQGDLCATDEAPLDMRPWDEAVILGWDEIDDGFTEDQALAASDPVACLDIPTEVAVNDLMFAVKIGGAPMWQNTPNSVRQGWSFAAQLPEDLRFPGTPPAGLDPGLDIADFPDEGYWQFTWANLAMGSALIFLDPANHFVGGLDTTS